MTTKNLAAALFLAHLLVFAGFASGSDFNLNSLRAVPADIQVTPAASPQAVQAAPAGPENPAPVKEWTVMIFMNGTNNLAPYFLGDVNAIADVGATQEVNISLEFSLMYKESSVVSRVRVLKTENGQPAADVYNTWENRDMGDWRNLADFVRWSKASFPAKRYMLIIQNHGGGFLDQTAKPKNGNKGISYDEISGNYIKIPELARVLAETGPVDMLVMNACEMQMAEVAYELGSGAGVILASEEIDRAVFFQYKERLAYLEANPAENAEKVATAYVELRRKIVFPGSEVNYGFGNSTHTYTVTKDIANTLSALRPAELRGLPAALDAWTAAVMAAGETEAVVYAVASTVRLGVLKPSDQPFSQFTDLWNFAWRVNYMSKDPGVKEATKELFAYLDKLVLANAGMNSNLSGLDYSKAVRGVSIKMIPLTPAPQSAVNPNMTVVTDTKYSDLRLSKDSRWDEFLAWAGQLYYRPR